VDKTSFICSDCGFDSPKWLGKCPGCGQWNTLQESRTQKKTPGKALRGSFPHSNRPVPTSIHEIIEGAERRLVIPDAELTRVLGGGIVPGSLILLGGEPGIGKSTLLLQLALSLEKHKVLYVSGEESEHQIKMRARRLLGEKRGKPGNDCMLLTETSTVAIFDQAARSVPDLIIIDSIQTLESQLSDSSAGSLAQVRESAGECMRFAKESHVPIFLIGHITKEGAIAGPKTLEHMVDTVLQFEGDRHYNYRILRTLKNRFGPSAELGIYEMEGSGLREVSNPSEILLSVREEELSGISISVIMEGARALLVECQALVSVSPYGTPVRSALGFDSRRMSMLLAVLEKRCGFRLSVKDVFLNITGGIKVEDPSIDLGLMMAIISSQEDLSIPQKTCFAAEGGLSGEIRAVGRIEQRIAEAEKLGFTEIYISKYNKLAPAAARPRSINVIRVATVEETVRRVFKRT